MNEGIYIYIYILLIALTTNFTAMGQEMKLNNWTNLIAWS